MAKKLIDQYAKFVSENPLKVFLITIILLLIGSIFYANIQTDDPDMDEILPDGYDSLDALDVIEDEFGGGVTSSFTVVVELDPVKGSQIYDIRDPEILHYISILTPLIEDIEEITGVNSFSSTVRDLNDGKLLNDINEVKQLIESQPHMFDRIINSENTLSVLRVETLPEFDTEDKIDEINKVIENTERPAGLNVELAGEEVASYITQQKVGPDMQTTTLISLFAIIIILVITMRSFINAMLPLATIIVGVAWALAFVGMVGIPFNTFTSGAISMIIGIGIDFGIQIIMRFKQELSEGKDPETAMETTIANVFLPMFTTTVAAFIGFQAMKLGELGVIRDLGEIMSIGVVFCFLAAITVVPSLLVFYEINKRAKNTLKSSK